MKHKNILFVCSGNQCRSPMAEALFENLASKDGEFRSAEIEIGSAGTMPYIDGTPATVEAIEVMREHGIDIGPHRARHIDQVLFDRADLILVMASKHKAYIHDRFGNDGGKVHLFTEFVGQEGDIEDPAGFGIAAYRECARDLQRLTSLLKYKLGC